MVDASRTMVSLARLGYVARGLVYGLIGYLSFSSTGTEVVRHGQAGALQYIHDVPGGIALLYICAAGLLGYALFRLSTALFDTERHGAGAKGITVRFGHMCSAVIHLGLSWTALQFAAGLRRQASDGTRDMVARVLEFDLGPVALGLAGAGLIAAALFQAKEAATLGFMRRVSPRAPDYTCWLGRFGYAARAMVFTLIGWSLIRSGWLERSSEASSLGSAILGLREMGLVHSLVALGLVLFGLFSLIVARYRVIPEIAPVASR